MSQRLAGAISGLVLLSGFMLLHGETAARTKPYTTLRHGKDSMPAFTETMLPPASVDALELYLASLPLGEVQIEDTPTLRLPQNPARYSGPPIRYSGSFSAGWYTSNGLPAIGPPWTQK